jgi:hypothetical protein
MLGFRQLFVSAFAIGSATAITLSAASAASAAPSQTSLQRAISSKLTGTWGDVYENGAEPALPEGWAKFGCGPQPAFIISGNFRQGFTAKAESMETGPVEGSIVLGQMDSKTTGRVVLPGTVWEQRLTIKSRDLMVLDAIDAKPDEPSPARRFLKRCR